MSEPYITGTGQRIFVHDASACQVGPCPIHHPSAHRMRTFKTHWRHDRKFMERICPHGVGHPDPDCRNAQQALAHGCDGCCQEGGLVP